MEEHQQHDNTEHGSTRVHEFAEPDAPGADGKEPRQHRDQASVGAFVAKVEEIGKSTGALGRKVRSFTDGGGITAVSYVDAWQRQVAEFYGMRLRKNYEFAGQFAKTGSIVDLLGLQGAYVRDMLADYASSVFAMTGFGLRSKRQTAERLDRSE